MIRSDPPPGPIAATRCTPGDLRLQFSAVHRDRMRRPDALERLRVRVRESRVAIEAELVAAPDGPRRSAIESELAQVVEIETSLARMDARDTSGSH